MPSRRIYDVPVLARRTVKNFTGKFHHFILLLCSFGLKHHRDFLYIDVFEAALTNVMHISSGLLPYMYTGEYQANYLVLQ